MFLFLIDLHNYNNSLIFSSNCSGVIAEVYLFTTSPFLSTKNFSKFHLTLVLVTSCDFKKVYMGAVLSPLTSTFCKIGKVTL